MPVFEHSIHMAVWEYIENNPESIKTDWPGWKDHPELDVELLIESNYCMACYYQSQAAKINLSFSDTPGCFWCPLIWPDGHCARGNKDGLYNKFRNCESPQFKSAYAKLIKELPVRQSIIRR